MSAMKVIETVYNGYRFRSRLEARWAVFFDALGIPYEYEKEGYDLDHVWYLPDFWLPEQDSWIEIKPVHPKLEERKKTHLLARLTNKRVYTFFGNIPIPDDEFHSFVPGLNDIDMDNPTCCGELHPATGARVDIPSPKYMKLVIADAMSIEELFGSSPPTTQVNVDKDETLWSFDYCQWWCECPKCGKLGIEFNGIYTRLPCPCYAHKRDYREYNKTSLRLVAAYTASRQARFER
jgi:hypothetical protein